MNLLSTDKVPTLLTLLVAIIGFFVTDIMEEIRSGRPLLYDLSQSKEDVKSSNEEENKKSTLSLENASRNLSIVGLEVMLFCNKAQADCLNKRDKKFFATPLSGFEEKENVYFQPSFSKKSVSEAAIFGELSLTPGGRIKIDFYPDRGMDSSLVFLVNPKDKQPVLLIPKKSIQGLFLRHYIEVMTLVFSLSVTLLLLLLSTQIFRGATSIVCELGSKLVSKIKALKKTKPGE